MRKDLTKPLILEIARVKDIGLAPNVRSMHVSLLSANQMYQMEQTFAVYLAGRAKTYLPEKTMNVSHVVPFSPILVVAPKLKVRMNNPRSAPLQSLQHSHLYSIQSRSIQLELLLFQALLQFLQGPR